MAKLLGRHCGLSKTIHAPLCTQRRIGNYAAEHGALCAVRFRVRNSVTAEQLQGHGVPAVVLRKIEKMSVEPAQCFERAFLSKERCWRWFSRLPLSSNAAVHLSPG